MGLVGAQADNLMCKLQTRAIYVAGIEKKGAPGEVTIGVVGLVGLVETPEDLSS